MADSQTTTNTGSTTSNDPPPVAPTNPGGSTGGTTGVRRRTNVFGKPGAARAGTPKVGIFPATDGTGFATTWRRLIRFPEPMTDVVAEFANYQLSTTAGEQATGNGGIVVAAAWEATLSDGTVANVPITFNGQSTIALAEIRKAKSDPSSLVFSGNVFMRIRRVATAASGNPAKIFGAYLPDFVTGEGVQAGDVLSATGSAGFNQNFQEMYGPTAISGTVLTQRRATVGIVCDSIGEGAGDWVGLGPIQRAFVPAAIGEGSGLLINQERGFTDWGLTGARQSMFTGNGWRLRQGNENQPDVIVCNATINGVIDGLTLAAYKTNQLAIWANWAYTGIPVIQVTLLPLTTSVAGDIWTNPATQVVTNREAVRTGVNDWYRDTSANGAIAQALAAGVDLRICDWSVGVEVNDANVPTVNGGKWGVGTSPYLFTATGGSLNTIVGPTSFPRNQFLQFLAAKITYNSGAASGTTVYAKISNNGTGNNTINLTTNLAQAVAAGDGIEVIATYVNVVDGQGVHPTYFGSTIAANILRTLLYTFDAS